MTGETLIIDTASEPGSWARALADTEAMRTKLPGATAAPESDRLGFLHSPEQSEAIAGVPLALFQRADEADSAEPSNTGE
jgi:hypothetical protein